jgi:hypothetical protein
MPAMMAARSVDRPSAIKAQNRRRTSRCETGGRPVTAIYSVLLDLNARLRVPIANPLMDGPPLTPAAVYARLGQGAKERSHAGRCSRN